MGERRTALWRGFLKGMGGIGGVRATEPISVSPAPLPQRSRGTIEGDWKRVGDNLSAGLQTVAEVIAEFERRPHIAEALARARVRLAKARQSKLH